MWRDALVLEDPDERGWTRFEAAKPFTDVDSFEIVLKTQTFEFVPGLVVGEDDLGVNPCLKIQKQVGQARAGTRMCDRRSQPPLFNLKTPRRIHILSYGTPPSESDRLHSFSEGLQFPKLPEGAQSQFPNRRHRRPRQEMPLHSPG